MEDESEPHLTREPSTSKGGSDMYSESWYKRRRLPSCNQAIMLRDRELGRSKRGGTSYRSYRDFYTTLPLNRYLEVPEFLGPRDHILGWTPDGLRLICLSFHLDAVRIYEYLGAQESKSARDEMVLSEMFRLQREIKTRQADLQFRFDCVLFTDDAKHMIIPASVAVADSNINMERLFRTNESLPLQGNHIEDYHFYCIDVAKGTVVGQLEFDQDRILLPHGVCISRRYLLITSYQHQVMHLIYINPQTGALELLREIGPSVRDDDPLHLPVSLTSHLRTSFLSGLKQILMTFLFKRAKEGGRERVKEYLRSCEYYTSLRIDKVVIFEEFFLLIRMLPREIGRETSALPCFFAIIDWREATVLEVYTAFDEKFYNCVSELAESLLFPITTDAWVGSDLFPIHARMTLSKGKKRGEQKHTSESLRRLLNQMPFPSYQPYKISAQSPYLDPHLFYLEDKTAAGILNGKTRLDIEDPRFMSSRSGRIAFQLPLSLVGGSTLRQVTLLFHPRDPLCLAVDRLRSDNCVIVFLPKSEDSEPPSDDAPPTESPPDRPATI